MASSMKYSASTPTSPPVAPGAYSSVPKTDSGPATIPTMSSGDAWQSDAACRGLGGADAALFFSEVLAEVAAAKRICAQCPVLAPCLEGAIARAEPCGVWGGQLFENGRVLMQKRRRGRPPKVARPEEELPVVAVPVHLADRLPLAG